MGLGWSGVLDRTCLLATSSPGQKRFSYQGETLSVSTLFDASAPRGDHAL